MKIAHLIAQFYPYLGGAEICVHNVCRTLSDAGHSATVICTTPPADKKPNLNYEIIHLSPKTCGLLRRMPFIGKYYLEYELSRLQKKHGFDLWQVTMGYPVAIYAVDFFNRNNIPCVLRCCGEDIQTYPEIGYGYRIDGKINSLVKDKYPLFDKFIANSQSMKEEYMLLGIPDEKIEIIPNGADLARFRSFEKNKELLKKITGADTPAFTILTVGRYHKKKGFDIIPSIASELKASGLNFQWIVAGKDTGKIIDEKKAAELNIFFSENISSLFPENKCNDVFSLPCPNLISLYKSSDLFVFPSLIEGLPTVCVEATAARLPSVVLNAPGTRDIVKNGLNGLYVESFSGKEFAKKIAMLYYDKNLYNLIKSNCLSVSNGYDWKVISNKYVLLYENILKARS